MADVPGAPDPKGFQFGEGGKVLLEAGVNFAEKVNKTVLDEGMNRLKQKADFNKNLSIEQWKRENGYSTESPTPAPTTQPKPPWNPFPKKTEETKKPGIASTTGTPSSQPKPATPSSTGTRRVNPAAKSTGGGYKTSRALQKATRRGPRPPKIR